MTYQRPPGAGQADYANAREFEEEVGTWLGQFKVGNLDSPTRLDYWVPGIFVEVKEKRQPLGERFSKLWPAVEPADLFVLDELSVRRALQHDYSTYFVLRDKPLERVFVARIDELVCAERVRVDRETSPGRKKGKWVLDLRQFRSLADPAAEFLPLVLADQVAMPWKDSPCLSQLQVPTV